LKSRGGLLDRVQLFASKGPGKVLAATEFSSGPASFNSFRALTALHSRTTLEKLTLCRGISLNVMSHHGDSQVALRAFRIALVRS
jgi:hypothetical protein